MTTHVDPEELRSLAHVLTGVAEAVARAASWTARLPGHPAMVEAGLLHPLLTARAVTLAAETGLGLAGAEARLLLAAERLRVAALRYSLSDTHAADGFGGVLLPLAGDRLVGAVERLVLGPAASQRAVGHLLDGGPGAVVPEQRTPEGWLPAASPADSLRNVWALEHSGRENDIAVVGLGGMPPRWRIELPGMAYAGFTRYPQDLPGSAAAVLAGQSAYTRLLTRVLGTLPAGSEVMLVGHSEGGIVAADVAARPADLPHGVRIGVVLTAGSPIDETRTPAATRLLSVEDDADLVVHLDHDSSGSRPGRLVLRYDDDLGSVSADHDARGYADHLDAMLAGLRDPAVTAWVATAAPFLGPATSATFYRTYDRF